MIILNIPVSVFCVAFLFFDGVELHQPSAYKEHISVDAMLDVLAKSHDGEEKLVKEKFLENYKLAGGTNEMAIRMYKMLSDGKNTDAVPLDEVEKNIKQMADFYTRNELSEDEFGEIEDVKYESKMRREKPGRNEGEANAEGDSDYLETFENGEEDEEAYPPHDPIYQPSDEEEDYEVLSDNSQNSPVASSKRVDSYEEDFAQMENLEEKQEKLLKKLIVNEDMEDHEPIYQPSEYEEIDLDEKPDRKVTGAEPVLSFPGNEPESEYEEIFAEEDENNDGYPDHDPIYQPEDSVMTKSLRKGDVDEDTVSHKENRDEL